MASSETMKKKGELLRLFLEEYSMYGIHIKKTG
jgi:hypothetical protein